MDSLTPQLLAERMPPAERLRVIIAAHGHPALTNGGAEIAAFELFNGLRTRADCDAWYLGCDRTGQGKLATVLSQPFSDREYLYSAAAFDWFKFANHDANFGPQVERLFAQLAPDVVHFHHYINFGVEVFLHLKRAVPNCRIVLTLHEYLAICHHYGQMVTTQHRNLCHQATPARCQRCFPEFDQSDFFLRKLYIDRFFDLVDVFISPSMFLAERYVAWGIPAAKMVVLENLMPPAALAPRSEPSPRDVLRLGFFGQISELKGIDLLFDAATQLEKSGVDNVCIEIFGDYRNQPTEFQTAFLARLSSAGSNIRFSGPYDRIQVDELMRGVDAVLVPSIWWENSPVVIQEALRNRRPVICANIGGMAEKVRDGVDGFHFPAGNPMALASLIRRLAQDREMLTKITRSMSGTPMLVSSLEDYLAIYRGSAKLLPEQAEHQEMSR